MTISYDKIADVLYITFSQPRTRAKYLEVEGGILRIDPETEQVVGVTIPFFQEKAEGGARVCVPDVGAAIFIEPEKVSVSRR
jgi:uncharacterized protein YuzE